jgi:hypothetical protein
MFDIVDQTNAELRCPESAARPIATSAPSAAPRESLPLDEISRWTWGASLVFESRATSTTPTGPSYALRLKFVLWFGSIDAGPEPASRPYITARTALEVVLWPLLSTSDEPLAVVSTRMTAAVT